MQLWIQSDMMAYLCFTGYRHSCGDKIVFTMGNEDEI